MKTLFGFTRFAFTAQKESRIIADGYSMNFLKCTAELTFSDKKNFVLHTKEFFPNSPTMYREINFKWVYNHLPSYLQQAVYQYIENNNKFS